MNVSWKNTLRKQATVLFVYAYTIPIALWLSALAIDPELVFVAYILGFIICSILSYRGGSLLYETKGLKSETGGIMFAVLPGISLIIYAISPDLVQDYVPDEEVHFENQQVPKFRNWMELGASLPSQESEEFQNWIDSLKLVLGDSNKVDDIPLGNIWGGYTQEIPLEEFAVNPQRYLSALPIRQRAAKITEDRNTIDSVFRECPGWIEQLDCYLESSGQTTRSQHFHQEALAYGAKKNMTPEDFIKSGYNKRLKDLV